MDGGSVPEGFSNTSHTVINIKNIFFEINHEQLQNRTFSKNVERCLEALTFFNSYCIWEIWVGFLKDGNAMYFRGQ